MIVTLLEHLVTITLEVLLYLLAMGLHLLAINYRLSENQIEILNEIEESVWSC